MQLRVKAPWQGKVAIRDKYYDKLKQMHEDLVIECEGRSMAIPYAELGKRVEFGKERYFDKFSGAYHHLCYFEWKPNNPVQLTLI